MIKEILFEDNGMAKFDTSQTINNKTGSSGNLILRQMLNWNFHHLLLIDNGCQGGAAHGMATSRCCSDCGPLRTTCKSEREFISMACLLES